MEDPQTNLNNLENLRDETRNNEILIHHNNNINIPLSSHNTLNSTHISSIVNNNSNNNNSNNNTNNIQLSNVNQAYIDSDSDSDVDENDTPPTIIKRKSDLPRKPKSKYKGVFRCGKKFKAQIQTNGVQHYLGLFDIEEDAARAYDVHARATLGPKAKTNFVYDTNENIVTTDFVIQSPIATIPEPPQLEHHSNRSKGAHPRRTYVGIKARRKRLSEGDVSNSSLINGQSEAGIDHDSPYSIPPRKRFCNPNTDGTNGHIDGTTNTLVDQDGNAIQVDVSAEQEDWREQLYHWKGHLSVDLAHNVAVWKGIWMTSWQIQQQQEGNAPNPAWNNNSFEYRCANYVVQDPLLKEQVEYPTNLPLPPLNGNYAGYYMMDNDDGGVLSRYSDSLCHLDFEKDETDLITVTSTDGTFLPPQSFTYLVVGKGESEFGPFLLQGLYNSW
eukprot:CAMPEP_0174818372 /NCGR_PEP_ID=MMETSP1107-20130205/1040_1 /TAXON_ID=36770 /ORGANISM="Paraphysomonas vestita, Strain GFlagA" /LENGTH=441 /DNA_ID=CAMNT_0016030123 /DNA_START=25 /DNA_END=1347 /DNA_ORIENTATION=-